MQIKRYIILSHLGLVLLLLGSMSALAQSGPTARLIVANSTNATLTIEVFRRTIRDHIRDKVTIKIPPLTEKTFIAPAGVVTLVANAYRSAPAKRFEEQLVLNANGSLNYNITPQKFGTTHLFDRPGKASSALTIAPHPCSQKEPKNAKRYRRSAEGGGYFYWPNGGVFCDTYYSQFATISGGALHIHKCKNRLFQNCKEAYKLEITPEKSEGIKKLIGPRLSWYQCYPLVQGVGRCK